MELVSPIVDVVKCVGGPIWRYLNGQIKFKERSNDFNRSRDDLLQLHGRIRSRLDTQLQNGRKIARDDVGSWLKEADEEIARQRVEDEVSGRGCLMSCVCRTRTLEKRTEELMQIFRRGEVFNNQSFSLVDDDYSGTLEDNVKIFREMKEKLQGKLHDVRRMLRSQLHFGKVVKEQVKIWQKQVEEITYSAAKDVEDKIQTGSASPSQHAFLANLLRGEIEKMKLLYNEGGQFPADLVINDQSTSAPELQTSVLEGRNVVKAKILAYLTGDKGTKLGVYGMGGVGKTTIMEHVYNQLLKESKFKKVIWITVSQTFDVHQIQQKIGIKLKAEEQLSRHLESVERAAMLSKILEAHKPYVLILDDVWRSFELKDIGIPESHANDYCKLVLTTRSLEVVREMRYDPIEMKILSHEASLKLFKHVVGDVALLEHEGIKETLKPIVDECDGLPLAIKVVASSMRGIIEPRLWRAALYQLRQGGRDDVFRTLKFSYDWLNDKKIQWCFLHCALYPEDYKIPIKDLVEYWMDEELIEVMETRQAMTDAGYAISKKLEENCLLELTRDCSATYGEHDCVRMHDLARDMALSITKSSSPRFLVKAGIGLRELPEEDEWKEGLLKVSFMSNKMEEIPSSMSSPRCPMLTTLLLSHNSFSSIPELFFEHMPELKVLDLSFNQYLKRLPSSISKLVKLTTLLLQHCGSLKKVPSLSNLTDLKKLNLFGTEIREAPHGLEKLIKLRYLAFVVPYISNEAIAKWEISLSEILPNLSKLQHLCMDPRIPVKVEVLGSLSKLEAFGGRFHSASDMRIFFISRRVSLHWYSIVAGRYKNVLNYAGIKEILCSEIDMRGEPNLLPSDLQRLFIESCNYVKSLNDVVGFHNITDLRVCKIAGCRGIEFVFSRSNRHTEVLEQLELEGLSSLNGIFEVELTASKKSAPPVGTFSSLEMIKIGYCPKITKLLPTSALLYLQNLKDIEVAHCIQLEEIFAVSSSSPLEEEEEEDGEPLKLTHLPKLEKLSLDSLPKLKSICGNTFRLICDSLETLRIHDCRELKRIPLHLPQSDNGQVSPPPHLDLVRVSTRKWWESLEWDQPNAKDVLLPFCRFRE